MSTACHPGHRSKMSAACRPGLGRSPANPGPEAVGVRCLPPRGPRSKIPRCLPRRGPRRSHTGPARSREAQIPRKRAPSDTFPWTRSARPDVDRGAGASECREVRGRARPFPSHSPSPSSHA
ncbi:hypothetical protein FM103_19320 [Corynebacterium xerosis]|nr:hypothetical protein FM103_19320 [Corynebacterium xerosis]